VEAVIEGVGDHGCEYMTGGRVVVLGRTGRNFAAGMSGGIAYVLDREGTFERRCNLEMSKLLSLEDPDEIEAVKSMIFRHARLTDSRLASQVLVDFAELVPRFVRVVPDDYGRVLQAQRRMRDAGMSDEEAAMAAFEVNARDESRIGGR
jgi:glutamate synthase (ferredoxin)